MITDTLRINIDAEVAALVADVEKQDFSKSVNRGGRIVLAAWCRKDRIGWQWILLLSARHEQHCQSEPARTFVDVRINRNWTAERPHRLADDRAARINARAEKITGISAAEAFKHSRQCDDICTDATDAACAKAKEAASPLAR